MLKGVNKDLIVEHGLVISFFLLSHLLQEELLLYEGIVQLGVGVAELVVFDKKLEALGESGLGSMVLGERRHHLRMLNDESGVKALGLKEFAYQLVNKSDSGPGVSAINFVQFALLIKEDLCFL